MVDQSCYTLSAGFHFRLNSYKIFLATCFKSEFHSSLSFSKYEFSKSKATTICVHWFTRTLQWLTHCLSFQFMSFQFMSNRTFTRNENDSSKEGKKGSFSMLRWFCDSLETNDDSISSGVCCHNYRYLQLQLIENLFHCSILNSSIISNYYSMQ